MTLFVPSSLIYLLIMQTDGIMGIRLSSNLGIPLSTPFRFFLVILMPGTLPFSFYLICGFDRMALFLLVHGLPISFIFFFLKSFPDILFELGELHTLLQSAFRMIRSSQWAAGHLSHG